MLTTKRLLLGMLLLGVVGMHGLAATGGTPTAHHAWATTTVATSAPAADHVHSSTTPDDEAATALALCMALLLALAGVVSAARRTTWVRQLDRGYSALPLPLPPVLRERSPVPRFTVMRC